jgi:endonuclease/exonuclease/phosphatase family metal-dependent hydrolase
MKLKITTFNLENLFNRYAMLDMPWEDRNYEKVVSAIGLVSIASREGDLVSYETTAIQRNNTAQAILDSEPDILAVQEIENIYTLRNFNTQYLDGYFDRMLSIDGNDPRGIDVGICLRAGLKATITAVRTHVDEPQKGKTIKRSVYEKGGYWIQGAIFSRDCLEVDVEVAGKTLTLLVNHLKAQDGTAESVKRRASQAKRVAELASTADKEGKLPIVIGDLNVDIARKDGSLDPLFKKGQGQVLQDPFPAGTWTHYYSSKKSVSRLDYVLPHKSLTVDSVDILRKGLTTKCKQYDGPRYPTIGAEHTEASDHCPTSVVLDL